MTVYNQTFVDKQTFLEAKKKGHIYVFLDSTNQKDNKTFF